MSSKNILSSATRYIAGRNAMQTVYWRSGESRQQPKMLKVSKTFNFGKTKESSLPPQHIRKDGRIIFV
ncbi:uncharacterized protein LOC123319264 [Coccinella septempunctata]|uniref:uncharacterized protein LOC123319264 n=1 Tax=Coccinella septempunctata TaxID=41139 RepID=UPI001D07727C|nr:uncharacterized protein LOC123319264 [Coccinella septempunctata]